MYTWAGREVDKLGDRRAQVLAWGGRAVIFPAFALALMAASGGLLWAGFGLALLLNGLLGALFSIVSVAGITTALDLSPRRGKGEAVGAYNSVMGMGMIVGGLLGGLIASFAGYYVVALTAGALSAVAIVILLRVRFPSIG
jgi:MFS family permease